MRKLAWLSAVIIVACGLAAALWATLQLYAGYNPAIASGAAGALATAVATAGAAAVQELDKRSDPDDVEDSISLKGVTLSFADRTSELADIKDKVRQANSRKQAGVAIMIYGRPGAGKTEFAIHSSNELLADLRRRAHRAGLGIEAHHVEFNGLEGLARTDPRDELRLLLGGDGTDSRRSSMNIAQLSNEWRRHLQGKFLILVLDNADAEAQIRPFIPGGTPFILLVTGRQMLKELMGDVVPYYLGPLGPAGALKMIRNIADRPLKAGDREAMERVAQLCGYLPQAIRTAVTNLSFDDVLSRLTRAPDELLAIEEYSDRGSRAVARSFELSYGQLSDIAKLVLKRMSIAPIPTISAEVAAVLADLPEEVVVASLDELVDGALVVEQERRGTYQMHDLFRRYAQSLSRRDDPADSDLALDRLLSYYWNVAAYADSIFTRQPPPVVIDPPVSSVVHSFADRPSAIVWIHAERPNLLACVDYAVSSATGGERSRAQIWVVLLSSALAGLLRNDGLWRRAIELQAQALSAAERLYIPLAMANALSERAFLYRLTGELQPSVSDLERAIALYRQVGGTDGEIGEAHALDTYGVVLDQLHNRDESRRCFSVALDIYQRLHFGLGVANVLHDLGMLEFFAGSLDEAVLLLERSLAIYREIDQPLGMAHAYSNLARAQLRRGDERDAAENLESARMLYRDLGNRLGELNSLVRLGEVLRSHDRRRAVKSLNDAIALSLRIGSQAGRVNALDELGENYLTNGHRKAALKIWRRALKIAGEYGLEREEDRLAGKVKRAG